MSSWIVMCIGTLGIRFLSKVSNCLTPSTYQVMRFGSQSMANVCHWLKSPVILLPACWFWGKKWMTKCASPRSSRGTSIMSSSPSSLFSVFGQSRMAAPRPRPLSVRARTAPRLRAPQPLSLLPLVFHDSGDVAPGGDPQHTVLDGVPRRAPEDVAEAADRVVAVPDGGVEGAVHVELLDQPPVHARRVAAGV